MIVLPSSAVLSELAAALMSEGHAIAAKLHVCGTHRSQALEPTLDRVLTAAARAGVTRIANVTGLDRIGIPVVMAVRPDSRTLSVWQGKSNTLVGAKISGAMEAIETACAEAPPPSMVCASPAEVGRLAPAALCARSRAARASRRDPLEWLEGYDLSRHRRAYVPRALVALGGQREAPPHFAHPGTNGLAAGNSAVEAAVHGICELIERDAEALWHASPFEAKRETHVDWRTVRDPACGELVGRFRAARLTVRLFDITSDLQVPAYLALIDDWNGRHPRLGRFGGTGCHPAPEVALFRALCEAAQSRLTFIVGAREDIPAANYVLPTASLLLAPALDLCASARPRRFKHQAGYRSADIAADLRWLLARLEACHIRNVIAVDLSRKDLRIPVIRVVAPGLENLRHHAGFLPGPRSRARSVPGPE